MYEGHVALANDRQASPRVPGDVRVKPARLVTAAFLHIKVLKGGLTPRPCRGAPGASPPLGRRPGVGTPHTNPNTIPGCCFTTPRISSSVSAVNTALVSVPAVATSASTCLDRKSTRL